MAHEVTPPLTHAIAGSLATASSKLLLYPLELVITRLQVQHQFRQPREATHAAKDAGVEYTSVRDALSKIYKTEGGFSALYTGSAPDVLKGVADSFLFFLAYEYLRTKKVALNGEWIIGRDLSIGILAGAFAKLLTTPVQNIVTRQQTAPSQKQTKTQ